MKKVIFWLCFALAIFLPTANQAKELHPAAHETFKQAEVSLQNFQAIADSLLFDDLLEDEPDDNLPSSERKKMASGKLPLDNAAVVAENYTNSFLKNVSKRGNFFIAHTTRNIYYSIFRL